MNKFLICDKCKGTDLKKLTEELKKLDPTCEIVVGCHNICGIGRTKPFVIFNNRPVIASSIIELITELKKLI